MTDPWNERHAAGDTGHDTRKADCSAAQQHTGRPNPSESLVSILIPAFNAQEWIPGDTPVSHCTNMAEKEIIVVDDGSTDQTAAIARQFESDSVRVVTQKNQGAASARNLAFSLCKGDYVQWLDADDLLAPDRSPADGCVGSVPEQTDPVLVNLGAVPLPAASCQVRAGRTLARSVLPLNFCCAKWDGIFTCQCMPGW